MSVGQGPDQIFHHTRKVAAQVQSLLVGAGTKQSVGDIYAVGNAVGICVGCVMRGAWCVVAPRYCSTWKIRMCGCWLSDTVPYSVR